MFAPNVGSVDRGIRVIIGVAALAVAFAVLDVAKGSIPGLIAAGVGVVMLLTAALGRCGLYVPLGINTCKAK